MNLLDEPELHDVNIVGSMLKSWLRELPDELLPRSVQRQVEEHCGDVTETPQMLRDELSKLPPYNYYILFAITCHISVLFMNSEKTKMNFPNLCICFQPCMGIDPYCFQWLVCDWKNCWQGCWTEKEYLDMEYTQFEEVSTSSAAYGYAPPYHGEENSMPRMQNRPTTGERAPSRDRDGHLMPYSTAQVHRRPSEADPHMGSSYPNRPGFTTPPGALSPTMGPSPMRM